MVYWLALKGQCMIPITANQTPANIAIPRIQARLETLSGQIAHLKMDPNEYLIEKAGLDFEKTQIDLLDYIQTHLKTLGDQIAQLKSIDPRGIEERQQKLFCVEMNLTEKERQKEACFNLWCTERKRYKDWQLYQSLSKKIAETEALVAGPFPGYAPYFELGFLRDEMQTFLEQNEVPDASIDAEEATKRLAELDPEPLELQKLKQELRSLGLEKIYLLETGDSYRLSTLLKGQKAILAEQETLQARIGHASIPVLRAQLQEKREALQRRFEESK